MLSLFRHVYRIVLERIMRFFDLQHSPHFRYKEHLKVDLKPFFSLKHVRKRGSSGVQARTHSLNEVFTLSGYVFMAFYLPWYRVSSGNREKSPQLKNF